MIDMTDTILAKSDQLNAEDLLLNDKIITITKVVKNQSDQPIVIHYKDEVKGRPWKPCKGMRVALCRAWGEECSVIIDGEKRIDGNKFVGKSIKIFRNPKVKWAQKEAGGIQISQLTNIKETLHIPITVSRGIKTILTITPLVMENETTLNSIADQELNDWKAKFEAIKDESALASLAAEIKNHNYNQSSKDKIMVFYKTAQATLERDKCPLDELINTPPECEECGDKKSIEWSNGDEGGIMPCPECT